MNNVGVSTFLRNFYAPGYSSITVSYFILNLSLRFYRYSEKNNDDSDYYDLKNGMTTTVNYEGAFYLYQTGMSVLNDINSEKEIRAVLPYNNAALILEYKPDENNQMAAYLTIEKNHQSIPYKFLTHQVHVNENEQMVIKVIQSGLGAFVKTVEGYLTGIGADLHLSKLLDNFENTQDENQQVPNSATTDDGYPYEYY